VFVFSSIFVVASWFLAMLLWDRALRPAWRERRPGLRYACITATGCALACSGFGVAVGTFYGAKVGVIAAFALAPVYVFIAVVLRVLLRSFDMDVDAVAPPSNEG
jgi:cation transporter-like permease